MSAAAAVQGPVTLVEADPSGGSLLSWCDDLRPAGDLYDAAMSRDPGGLAAIVQRLGDVAVVPSWGRPFRTAQALMRPRVPWDLLFDEVAGTVVVDLGRLYPDAPTWGVLSAMDVIVLVSASEPGPVAATMEWAAAAAVTQLVTWGVDGSHRDGHERGGRSPPPGVGDTAGDGVAARSAVPGPLRA